MPSHYQIARAFAHKKIGKAPGEDRRGGEIYKSFPEEMADIYSPIEFKSKGLCDMAFQFKGGQLHDLHKGGNNELDLPESHRDVLLADEAGKTLQANNRQVLNSVVSSATVSTQWGSGLHNGATDVVHLYMNACRDLAELRQLSVSCIFLDIKTAYASIQRELFLESLPEEKSDNKEPYIKKLLEIGFSEADAEEVYKESSKMYQWL